MADKAQEIKPEATEWLLRRPAVSEITTLPASTITDFVAKKLFPAPLKLGDANSNRHGIAVWRWSEVKAWMDSLPRAG